MSSSLCDPRQYQHLHHINIGQEIKINSQWKHKGSRNTSGFDAFLNVVLEEAEDPMEMDTLVKLLFGKIVSHNILLGEAGLEQRNEIMDHEMKYNGGDRWQQE